MAESLCPIHHEYIVENVTLTTVSATYIQGDVSKDGYTPVGILSVDASGLGASQSIRLFYLQDTMARISFSSAPTGATATVTILYMKT